MRIKEVGIIARGFPLVFSNYSKFKKNNDELLRSAILSGLLHFFEAFIFKDTLDYIEGNTFIIAFQKAKIRDGNSIKPETIIAYLILNKIHKRNLDKFITKRIKPYLYKVLKNFILKYDGENLNCIFRFQTFKENIDKVFKLEATCPEEKFKGIF